MEKYQSLLEKSKND